MMHVQDEVGKIVQGAVYSSIILYVLLVIGWAIKAILETAGVREPTQLPITGHSLWILSYLIKLTSSAHDALDVLVIVLGLLLGTWGIVYYLIDEQEKEVWGR